MIGVDCPRDVYLASKALRTARPAGNVTAQNLLDSLYIGAGAIPDGEFYEPLWQAIETEILLLERELNGQPKS